jgi:light-regulated signal transduction histidine kinase (bacteriophytochrome)
MHILIIDDTQADHELAVDCLESSGGKYVFHHAYSAAEGLRMYEENPIDCVLLDYRMPGDDGLDVLGRLANNGKIVPVIMMTGDGSEYVAVTAMKLGSQDYIPKRSLNAGALKRAVERVVERTEIAQRMEKYRSELERSNHDLEQFANIIAHDLKSPLRAVTQHLGLVVKRQSEALDEKSKRSISFAVEGAERMRMLIDAVYEYARIGFTEPTFATVSLDAVLECTLRDLSVTISERNAQVISDPLPKVKGDPLLLSQLLQNLIANAIKYCDTQPRIHISASMLGTQWRITVADNGIGIAERQHEQIFAIFRRLHSAEEYPGIGLGLAICSRIVKQHGGSIGVVSEPGKGACFSFTLPVPVANLSPERRERAFA